MLQARTAQSSHSSGTEKILLAKPSSTVLLVPYSSGLSFATGAGAVIPHCKNSLKKHKEINLGFKSASVKHFNEKNRYAALDF